MGSRLAALVLLAAGAGVPAAGVGGQPAPPASATPSVRVLDEVAAAAGDARDGGASAAPAATPIARAGGGDGRPVVADAAGRRPAYGHRVTGRRGVALPARSVPTQTVEGLTQDVSTSYRVDADSVVTRVTVSATLTNTSPDRVVGDYVEYYYFDSYTIPVPSEATNVTGRTGDGAGLAVSVEADPVVDWVSFVTAPFGANLRYGQTRTVVFSYDLATQPFRATDILSQANEAFYMFPVLPLGDPGLADVHVQVPDTYDVEVVGDDLQRSSDDGHVVLEATAIGDPLDFWALVLASDESRLTTETVEVEGATVHVQAWPGDTEWSRFVIDNVEAGVDTLTEMTGQPWPEDDLTVIETMTPIAQGYGGWYEAEEHTIRIGNELDPQLMLHELAHVWINFDVFDERWLVEGYAEVLAFEALGELGLPPTDDPPGRPAAGGRVPLSRWVNPVFVDEQATVTETYGYDASWYLVDAIAEEVGMDAMQDVLTAAVDGTITYPGDGEPEQLAVPMDWRRALDLFENVGGSESAAELFGEYVVDGDQRAELEARAGARESYAALTERGGGWSPPLDVRDDMAEWEFDTAAEAMAAADAILDVRDRIDDELDDVDDLDVEELALAEDYETADDLDELQGVAEETLAAAEAYAEVDGRAAGGGGPLRAIGLLWSGTDGRLDDARGSLAAGDPARSLAASDSVASRLDGATRDGLLRLGLLVVLVGGAAAVPVVLRRRRPSAAGPGGPPGPGGHPGAPLPPGPPSPLVREF